MLNIALTLLAVSILLWIILFIVLKIGPRTKARYDIGGGVRYGGESWSTPLESPALRTMSHQDAKLLHNLYLRGNLGTLDEIELLTKESTQAIAERLKRLEALGLVTRTSTGEYEVTEYGRRIIEMYKEKLAARRREEELLERT